MLASQGEYNMLPLQELDLLQELYIKPPLWRSGTPERPQRTPGIPHWRYLRSKVAIVLASAPVESGPERENLTVTAYSPALGASISLSS